MNLDWLPVFAGASPPIYTLAQTHRTLFYAPGWVVAAGTEPASAIRAALLNPQSAGWGAALAAQLHRQAAQAEQAWLERTRRPYQPVCLTLYLTHACNLACAYCFASSGSPEPGEGIPPAALQAAAQAVAQNCRAQGRPLTVVMHGGGEPTLSEKHLVAALEQVEAVAARYSLPLFRYLATNGAMPREKAARVVRRFDLVGLSCDGPPEIQNMQRPLHAQHASGRQTSAGLVEQTARAVHAAGVPLHVRVTLTPATFQRQAEIAAYICAQLAPQEIHVEPVYAGGRAGPGGFEPGQAAAYHAAFLAGRAAAARYGVRWLASGSRPDEIHGAFCQVFRDVLNLTPRGAATACFKTSRADELEQCGLQVGGWQPWDQQLYIDAGRVTALRQQLEQDSPSCRECFNRHHCARLCPDVCLLETGWPAAGFRCQTQALLSHQAILETAERVWPAACVQGAAGAALELV